LEDTVKQNGRQHTALEKTNIKSEEACGPQFGFDFCSEFFVVVEDQFLNISWDVILVQRKLDQIVFDRAVGISKVNPRNYDLSMFAFGVLH
jgi:hypothetical protein